MAPRESVIHWIERWQQGDPVAAEELFRRYATRLSHVAEQHLSRRVKAREDGEDVVQSVFRSFFRRCADGDFRIDSADQLWRLLVSITLFKARSRVRHHTADKRDVGGESANFDFKAGPTTTSPSNCRYHCKPCIACSRFCDTGWTAC